MMVGYEMGRGRTYTEEDVDNMWASDAASEWEKLNEEDPNVGRYVEAVADMKVAIQYMSKAADFLAQAMDDVYGLPLESKISSILDQINDLESWANNLKKRVEIGDEQ